MQKFLVSVYSWENPRVYESDAEISSGEKVVVASEFSNEIGTVEKKIEKETDVLSQGNILRVATSRDKEVFDDYEIQKEEALNSCRQKAKDLGLEIKLIDSRISLDGRQILFAFTAEGRVDFRELVRSLSRDLRKTVRMQQIGSRDEARKLGGYGICGRELCCVNFPGSIQSITTDMARMQQISHRGAERISGLCGRLMCCLSYEAEQYKKMLEGMPEIYSIVKTKDGSGTVIEINAVKQEIKVKLESGKYVNIKKEDLK